MIPFDWLDDIVLAALVATAWTQLFIQADRIATQSHHRWLPGEQSEHTPPRVLTRIARSIASALRRRR